jgi:hypothetical protein
MMLSFHLENHGEPEPKEDAAKVRFHLPVRPLYKENHESTKAGKHEKEHWGKKDTCLAASAAFFSFFFSCFRAFVLS